MSDAGTPPTRDPGLQPERTQLAWRRTALAMTGIMLLTVRLALIEDGIGTLVGALAVVGWIAALSICWRRATGAGPAGPDGWALPLIALATAGFALLGALLVLRGLW